MSELRGEPVAQELQAVLLPLAGLPVLRLVLGMAGIGMVDFLNEWLWVLPAAAAFTVLFLAFYNNWEDDGFWRTWKEDIQRGRERRRRVKGITK